MEKPLCFCFGLGYVAEHLSSSLKRRGWEVVGTRTQVHPEGPTLSFPDNLPDLKAHLTHAKAILISIPPQQEGDVVLKHYHALFKSLSPTVWVGYLSSTSVYGDHQGAWVDETSLTHPTSSHAHSRLLAEQQWLSLHHTSALAVHVFRLAGIYGPGRNMIERLKQGEVKNIVKPGQVFSRIHIDDIVAVLEASLFHPTPGEIFNLADDEPASPEDVLSWASEISGLSLPPPLAFEEAQLSSLGRAFYQDNKRVTNQKIKTFFKIKLKHPNYRLGLHACLSGPPLKS